MRREHLGPWVGAVWAIVSAALPLEAGTSHAAEEPARGVVIFHDASLPPVAFAVAEIRRALKENGFFVEEKTREEPAEDRSPVRIMLWVADPGRAEGRGREFVEKYRDTLGKQGYLVTKLAATGNSASEGYLAAAIDPVGAMYGGLHLAESIRIHKGLDGITRTIKTPHIARRGIKFNIPLDVRTPGYDDTGDAAQKNYEHMWDFAFWQEFLDEMARHRYNTLSLWNPHPFPSIVKCPSYPDVALDDVCVTTLKPTYQSGAWRDPQHLYPEVFQHLKVVRKMSIDEKITFWRRVMRHAKDRGIDVYLITWNVLTNGTQGKYGITNDQDNPTTIAYLRESVCQTILTYPDLAGIGVTAGENMQNRDDEFSKEKWLWKTYGLGVMDAKEKQPGRHVRFLHRVWQTGLGGIMEDFGAKYPDTFEVGFKYARAHMYSSPDPPFDDQLCQELRKHKLKCWWNLRNDDIFNFRWGDPDYAREFILHLPPNEITAGYHMGSDGYVWGVEHTSTQPDSPRQLEIKKHWYRFMLWGRLGYDPTLDRAFFEKVLAARFPEAPAAALYDAWQSASKIIPLVNRFHWNDWDFMWAVEGCMDQRQGFHTVDDFIRTPPMQRSGIVSISDYVEGQLADKPTAGISPIEVAEELRRHARDSLVTVAAIRRKVPNQGKELRLTLADIEAMAHLGNYYSAKILGGVELCAFRELNDARHKEAAIKHLLQAVNHWERYAAVAAGLYRPQLLARTRRTDWMKILEDVKHDVEIARTAGK
jgi:hypothetical protein